MRKRIMSKILHEKSFYFFSFKQLNIQILKEDRFYKYYLL